MTTQDSSQDQDSTLYQSIPYEEPRPPGSGRLMKIITVLGSIGLIWLAFTDSGKPNTGFQRATR